MNLSFSDETIHQIYQIGKKMKSWKVKVIEEQFETKMRKKMK